MTALVDRFVLDRLPAPDALPVFAFDRPELQYSEHLNAAVELIDRGDGERIAVRNDVGEWSYAALADLSDRIARVLVEDEGLVPGNRVLLRGPNGAMLFAAWLGVLKAGGVVVTTMPLLRAGEIAAVLDKAQPSHAIVDSRYLADFTEAATRIDCVRSTLRYDGDAGTGALEARLANTAPGFAAVTTRADGPALIAFTSGTTGNPKGCVHFHRDILACADAFAGNLVRPKPGDVFCTSAPIGFTFGLGATLIFPFRFGGTAVTLEQATPRALLDAIARHGVTTVFTAPTAYKAMLALGVEAGSLHTCVSAGEHLPAATWQAWHDATGIRIIDGIGATEMMHIFISAAGDDIHPGATGKAVPGYTACVLDPNGQPMSEGIGRLAVRGPTGCRYLADERQSAYVVDGWNVTGDTYRADAEGYFWYLARSDDMIVSSGYNIAAPEVENTLYAHPAVAECAVIGVPCPTRGQLVKAFVVLAPGYDAAPTMAEALQAHVKATIAPYKYPRAVEFVDALPKTASGKVRRFALQTPAP
ncbi:MAG: 2-aminobenzoate-CoA ligase [Sphingomonas sp.]|uniref:AMP-binding protein n=1 Tax=Sphingomonas sp. TaxID=28214 RepID=UPI001223B06D|nr:AMP-binding protein [Sphingomonas sp.]THD37276.1 MAG: 2-aminobenzoate-CoA ligase [Sphingomonas sp.]